MKTIKILAATVALGLGVATAAFAQPPADADGPPGRGFGGPGGPGGPNGPLDIERLTVLLDLDAYQKQEVGRVLTEQRDAALAERKAVQESGVRPNFADVQSRREQARESTFAKLQNVLSETQMTKLKLLTEPPAGGRGGRRGPPRDGGDKAPAADGN